MTSAHGHDVLAAKFAECSTVEQIADAGNPVVDYRTLADKRITITSIRERPSRYKGKTFADAGFRSDEYPDGARIQPGGTLGRYLLSIERYKLPVTMILRPAGISRYGDLIYNWERM